MTTIVWDGKTLAADKQWTDAGIALSGTKIHKFKKHLLFAAGATTDIQAMLEWWKRGADPKDFPSSQSVKENMVAFQIIKPNKTLWCFEAHPYPYQIENDKFAVGSGRNDALGALSMGADAVKAVEIACQLDIHSGCGIDTLTL